MKKLILSFFLSFFISRDESEKIHISFLFYSSFERKDFRQHCQVINIASL